MVPQATIPIRPTDSEISCGVLVQLRAKTAAHMRRIEESAIYRRLTADDADPQFVAGVAKYILLEVFSYGPHVTEATFTAIGRMPKQRPDLMRPMIEHDLEEVDHGEMALRDFVALGGSESWARSRQMSPPTLVLAATVRMLAEREDPFAYLGYMYAFEALTPRLAAEAQAALTRASTRVEGKRFVELHAKEDIVHEQHLAKIIIEVVGAFPQALEVIEYGFDCFAAVYPIPIWEHAERSALADLHRQPSGR